MQQDAEPQNFKVFVSYSRKDQKFADELVAGLDFAEFSVSIDRHSIIEGEDWRKRLGSLIEDTDTVVFVLSPDSASSEICRWEVEHAQRFSKRIIPVLCRPLDGVGAPEALAALNYVRFDEGRSFIEGLKGLVRALHADLDWLREHTRLLARAMEWDRGGRIESRLLSGNDIFEAKSWAARRPKDAPAPTPLHLEFIKASEQAELSRQDQERRRLAEIDAAQAERTKALEAAEQALKRTIALQRRIAWAGALTLAILAAIGWWAYGIAAEKRVITREAAREDLRGQIVAYGAAKGNTALDVAPGYATSPYTTSLASKLKERKNLIDVLIEVNSQALALSNGQQRPFLSTDMNGHLYLHQQPPTRRKRALVISCDDVGIPSIPKLAAPLKDAEAILAVLLESGFDSSEVIHLHNPGKKEIEAALDALARSLKAPPPSSSELQHPGSLLQPAALIRIPPAPPRNTMFLFFFSGHGLSIDGLDYLLPRVSEGSANDSAALSREAVQLQRLTSTIDEAAAASVVILDTHFPPLYSPSIR